MWCSATTPARGTSPAPCGTATVGIYWCGNLINAAPITRTHDRVAVSFRTSCALCGMDQGRGRCPHDPSLVADVAFEEVLRHVLDLHEVEEDAAVA